ncbi:VWA domain-containing protein [Sulfurimonas sp. HSL-3221]|uniref:vWA domain-containing protein n=1 Tax=Sulfurimonadaceae TaxID=2771471 RepID=UPI001E65C472|nr:VWA domain-containing protein [Sulfurimonas sp. HSL-3221]UFS62799.1 VWA domain-containing protein [Sulfurimonas sp. HSL-3221]
MHFEQPHLLFLLIVLVPLALLLFAPRKAARNTFAPEVLKLLLQRTSIVPQWLRSALLLAAAALFIVALARPVIDNGEIKVQSSTIDLIVGFDLSRSMFANDVYPSRLALAKRKFDALLGDVNGTRIGVIGFSARAFMVSPLTEDFATLRYLVSNMNTDSISLRGTDLLQALQQTDTLLEGSNKKALLLFTDGGDGSDFDKEIAYAKAHNIVVFLYNIGTEKGGVIPTGQGAMTDKHGDIVVVRRNDDVKALALQSGGAYLPYSLKHNDIKALADALKSRFTPRREKNDVIRDLQELFVWPLGGGVLLLLMALYSLPQRRRRHA